MKQLLRYLILALSFPWILSCESGSTSVDPPAPNQQPRVLLSVDQVTGSIPLQVNVEVGCVDPDGTASVFELDAEGDGLFEVSSSTPIHHHLALLGPVTVVARCGDDEGLLSDPESVSVAVDLAIGAPAAPSDISAHRVSLGQVDLSWTDNSDNEVEFKIEQRLRDTGEWEQIGSVGEDVASYSYTGLNSVHTNLYRVRACTSTGCSDYSTQTTTSIQQGPPGAPTAPTGLTANAVSPSRINLSWTDGSNDEVAFLVFRFWGGPGIWEQIALLGSNTTSHSDTGLEPGTSHYYLVLACTATVCSGISNLANAQTLGTTPPVASPSGLSAVAVSSSQINLYWTDNSDNEVQFLIFRSPNGATDWVQAAGVEENATTHSDTGLYEGTWYYTVIACNYDTCSPFMESVQATIGPPSIPNAPSGLQALAVSSDRIDLSWTDNSADEFGFLVTRSLDGVTGWNQIAILGLDTTDYPDTGVNPGTRYYYLVQACGFDGCSEPSNVADAIPSDPDSVITVNMGPNPTETVTQGQELAVPVLVDMTAAGGLDVASIAVDVSWDPSKFTYDSFSTGTFGLGVADESDVATGTLHYSLSSVTGTEASFTAFTVNLTAETFAGSTFVAGYVTSAETGLGSDITSVVTERNLTAYQTGGPTLQFDIELEYVTNVDPSYRSVFEAVVARWEEVIVGDAPDYWGTLPANSCQPVEESGPVDDLKIFVSIESIDGPGGALAQAHPCYYRASGAQLPITGRIRLDAADLPTFQSLDLLEDLVLHEMGHALGIGLLWFRSPSFYLQDAGMPDPYFSGPAAIAAFDALGGSGRTDPKVPVENTGPLGVRDAHWRESVFDSELMSSYLEATGGNPLSLITIASLEDLGYTVDPTAADAYTLPFPIAAAPGNQAQSGVPLIELPGPRPLPAPGGH